jgi:hypothetical protein
MAHMDADSVREELRTALKVSTVNFCIIELKMKGYNTLGKKSSEYY